jgi:hypothetical protein
VCAAADAKDILRGVAADNKIVVAKLVDQAAAASDRWSCAVSEFLEPPLLADAMLVCTACREARSLLYKLDKLQFYR